MSDDLDLVGRVRLDTSGFHTSISEISESLKGLAEIAVVAFAVEKAKDFFKESIEAAREAAKQDRETADVIEHMGNVAGISAEGVHSLSEHISNLTGVQRDTVESGANMLLTFGNIKNQVGSGNDIFNQATATITDFSARFGQDLPHSAVLVGKALNDPILGMTALRRVGVQLTDQQQEQVKAMVKSGDIMGAQKVILAELGRETGGAAAAAADPWSRFQNQMHNFKEDVGTQLLPTVNQLVGVMAKYLPDALELTKHGLDIVIDGGKRIFDAFKALATGDVQGFAEQLDHVAGNTGNFVAAFRAVGDIVRSLIGWFGDFKNGFTGATQLDLGPVHSINGVLIDLGIIVRDVANFIEDHWKPILIGLGVWFALAVAPITSMVLAVIYAYTHFATFNSIVNTAITDITTAIAWMVGEFQRYWPLIEKTALDALHSVEGQIDHLVAFGRVIWPQLEEAATHVFHAIRDVIGAFVVVVKAWWETWGNDILLIAHSIWNAITGVISAEIKIIENIIRLVLAVINGDWGKAWDALKGIVAGVWDGIFAIVRGATGILEGIVKGIGTAIAKAASGLFDGIKDAFRSAIDWIIDKWNGLGFTLPKVSFLGQDIGGQTFNVPQVPRLAKGGTALTDGFAVVGDGGDGSGTELAYLRKGATIDPRLPEIMRAAGGGSGDGPIVVNLNFNGPTDGDSVRGAIPDLIDALNAGVGKR